MQGLRRLLKNESGQIVFVMVAALVTATAAVTMIQISNVQKKGQAQMRVTVNTIEAEERLRNALKSDLGWKATLADTGNTTLACLRNSSTDGDCKNKSGSLKVIYDETGTTKLIDLTIPPPSGSPADVQGLTLDGEACSGFVEPPADGNGRCPYGVKVEWQAIKRGTNIPDRTKQDEIPDLPSCTDDERNACDVRIIVKFQINGSKKSMTKLHLNEVNYYVDFSRRNLSTKGGEIVLIHKTSGHGGRCGKDWKKRGLNTKVIDTNNNVVELSDDKAKFKQGSYSCEVTAPAAVPFLHQASLHVATVGRLVGTSSYYYSSSFVKASFTINSDQFVRVDHVCEDVFGSGNPSRDKELGQSLGAGQNVYTVLRCVKKAD